jgi:NTP pyrophosphatase (non-canonical NTP hydrolase)
MSNVHMESVYEMTDEVTDWVDGLIPDDKRDPFNTAIKLSEEVSELLHALYTKGDVGAEVADIMILLLDVAYLSDVDIVSEFYAKMAVNKGRRWTERNGSLSHE